jgi:hypothetical protein
MLMGVGRLVTLLSWVPALFGPTIMGGLLGGGLAKHRTKAWPQMSEAWSPSLDGDLDSLIRVERVSLVCA